MKCGSRRPLWLAAALLAIVASVTPDGDNQEQPFGQYDFYHSCAALQAELGKLSCDGYSFQTVGNAEAMVPVVRLAQSPTSERAADVMMVFGEHPRELISPEVGLNIVRTLCSEGGRHLRAANSFTLVLNANPAGRRKIETDKDWCVRANEDDVDLNRNYGKGWAHQKEDGQDGVGVKAGKHFETFSSGTSAFSEPETQIVRDILQQTKPHLFVDVHSGTNAVILPWSYTNEPIDDRRQQARMMRVAQNLSQDCPDCTLGPGAVTVGYKATGTASDYAFSLGVPYSFTTEIYTSSDRTMMDMTDSNIYEARKHVAEHDGSALSDDVDSEDTAEALLRDADLQAKTRPGLLQSRGRLRRAHFLAAPDTDSTSAFANDAADISVLKEEAYKNNDKRTSECFREFNPASKPEYDEVVGRWTKALLRLSSMVRQADEDVL